MRQLPAFALLIASPLLAQAPHTDFRVILPKGPGAITVHVGDGWKVNELHLYPDGPRASLFITNDQLKLEASYLMFANDTTGPNSEACRKAVMGPVIDGVRKRHWELKNVEESTHTTPSGLKLSVASYLVEQAEGLPVRQENVFAFLGDTHNCAELHLSKVLYQPSDEKLFNVALDKFSYDENYIPTSQDYGSMATMFFEGAHDNQSAAVYYETALATLPDTGIAGYDGRTMRRVLTDQLSMSYGMSGDLKRSRAVNEAAIAKDPDYPLYYYNLACADAEAGDATAAKLHLQLAFDRRANTIKGETMPDPTKDDSILKLKKDKAFWAFVGSLPRN